MGEPIYEPALCYQPECDCCRYASPRIAELEAQLAAARLEEREACARVADTEAKAHTTAADFCSVTGRSLFYIKADAAHQVAAAIRSRTEESR